MRNSRRDLLFCSLYLTISIISFFSIHKGLPGRALAPFVQALAQSGSSDLAYPGHADILIRKHFTGVNGIDEKLSLLVGAFLGASRGFPPQIRAQQMNFMINLASGLAVFSIESVRFRGWTAPVFTSLWAVAYQLFTGAVVIPLYLIAHTYSSYRPNPTRDVPPIWAQTLLPSIIIGFILPTAFMYYPSINRDYTMIAIAIWQLSPIYINIVWIILRSFSSEKADSTRAMKRCLRVVGAIGALSHISTLVACFTHYSPVTFNSVFIPTSTSSALSLEQGSHMLFQIDYLAIFAATTIWAFQVRARDRAQIGKQGSGIKDAVLMTISTVLLGPGATLAGVWDRRVSSVRVKKA